jgi:adenosylhomocysteine nucleosidase
MASDEPHIGFLCGLQSEKSVLQRSVHGVTANIEVSAARIDIAYAKAETLVSAAPDGVISFGTAGGLDPLLRPGDLVVASHVNLDNGARIGCDAAWSERICRALNLSAKAVYGSQSVLDPLSKQLTFDHQKGVVVDMESHILGAAAEKQGIPFAVLRAVLDPADFDVPSWTLDAVRHDGGISLAPIFNGLSRQPWHLGRLAKLGWYERKALKSLGRAVRAIGPRFAVGGL